MLEVLKQRLLAIAHFSFEASTTLGTQGWQGTGKGNVKSYLDEAGNLIFEEKGLFCLPTGKELPCTNVYRWTFETDVVKLEHLRFGANNPVYLFHLGFVGEQKFVSVCPHACDRDFYEATLTLSETVISLLWIVRGQEKDEKIEYFYF